MDPTESVAGGAERPSRWASSSSGRPREGETDVASPRGARRPPPARDRPEDRIGQVLGSYRLLAVLGRGGMGCVYLAEHVRLGREVALKLLRDEYAERRDSVARFFQEARAVNRIRHRNIVDVTDFVELDDGTVFIIMELLAGENLGNAIRRGELAQPRALAVLIQICDALAAAHADGIIHRDLKPDNVILVRTGDGGDLVKLLDFGVAKLLHREDEELGLETAAGSVIGTPAYMSPEQAGGLTVDTRADIYSLGAIMYELFCGQPMFRAKSFGEYVRKHLNEHPPAPRETPGGAALDPAIERIILRCIAKRADDRYPSATALRVDLVDRLSAFDNESRYGAPLPAPAPSGATMAPLSLPPLTNTAMAAATPAPTDASALGWDERVGNALGWEQSRSGESYSGPSIDALLSESHEYQEPSGAEHLPPTAPYRALAESGGRMPRPTEPSHVTAMAMGDLPTWSDRRASGGRLWLAAGALVVVGLVGAALWLRPTPAPAVAPEPTPIARPAPAPIPPVVTPIAKPHVTVDTQSRPTATVRLRSAPRAAVYPIGSSTPTCRTPCDVTVELPATGADGVRHFVLREEGYRDHLVTLDLTALPNVVEIELAATRSAAPQPPTIAEEPPSTAVEPTVEPPAEPTPAAEPAEKATPRPEKRRTRQPPRKRERRNIDVSDTLNPFGNP